MDIQYNPRAVSEEEARAYRRAWYEKNKEAVKARSRAWSAANKERKRATNKAYREANRERLNKLKLEYQQRTMARHLERSAAWRSANLDRQRQAEARYRERNREACNERIKVWKRQNRDRLTIYALVRGRGVKQATPKWADFDAIRQIYEQAAALRMAGQDVHVDHIVPIFSPKVCGLHWEGNLRIVPRIENLKKCNYRWPDMP